MKILSALLFLPLGTIALAELPKPAPNFRYSSLWENSPFTTKPPPPESAPEANPLEDYALAGVSPVPGGYRVTIINKKNPEERIFIPDDPNFKILAVQYSPGNPLGTTVRLSTGTKTGIVSMDEKLLVLKAPPTPQPPQQPNMPPGAGQPPGVPNQPSAPGQTNAETPRQPRPRVVPPVPNGAPNAPQTNSQPPVPQSQQQRQPNQQRLNRR